jgi:hypothetical protein
MIVLQTLGKQSGQHGIFQYNRKFDGVHIDLSIGNAPSLPVPDIMFTHDEWIKILRVLKKRRILNLTGGTSAHGACLHDLIKRALPNPTGFSGQGWNDSYLACVCAILQHEGSIVFYTGGAGQGNGIAMHFSPAK